MVNLRVSTSFSHKQRDFSFLVLVVPVDERSCQNNDSVLLDALFGHVPSPDSQQNYYLLATRDHSMRNKVSLDERNNIIHPRTNAPQTLKPIYNFNIIKFSPPLSLYRRGDAHDG